MDRLSNSKRQILEVMAPFTAATAARNMTKAAYAAVAMGIAATPAMTAA
jgi:voltage-gated potassium channel